MCLRTTSEAAIVALLLTTPALGAEPKDFLVSASQPRELRIMLDGVNAPGKCCCCSHAPRRAARQSIPTIILVASMTA